MQNRLIKPPVRGIPDVGRGNQPKQTMNTDQEIIENKSLRRDSDLIIQRVKALPTSRERSMTITKLQEAVMWLGMDLKRINEAQPGVCENPYPDSKDPSNTNIAPMADGLKL